MSHVEITLKSGVTIKTDTDEWITSTNRATGALTGFKWTNSGSRELTFINASEVAAVVFVQDEVQP
jgi:hypothetical protein